MKKELFKNAEPYKEENIFYSLGPRDDVDENNIYYNRFRTAITKNCKIIAFTGRYGIGKTSIINSIIKKLNNNEKNIRISLGNYKQAIEPSKDGQQENSNFIDANDIETKILQQIIYTTDENKLPMSRFKRIKYITSGGKIIILSLVLFFIIMIYVYFPKIYKAIFGTFYDFLVKYLPNWISLFINILFFLVIVYVIYRIIIRITMNINAVSLKYKDLEINTNNDNKESIFNKYLDEIFYFFKQTKTNIMIIEDLDRYGNVSLDIFKKLKDLNFMLNENKTIKNNGGVIFIYALRDDLFLHNEDRVKFFDTIIPVVSKFSNKNAKEYIMEQYQTFKENYKISIDEKLLNLISMHIHDRRLLLNIFMEFKTYIDNLKNNQDINWNELFALISYKNINPIDFEKRVKYTGDLYNIFYYKYDFIRIINNELIEENNNLKNEIEENKKIRSLEIIDVKKSFLVDVFRNIQIYNTLNNLILYIGEVKFTMSEFLSLDIDVEEVRNKKFEYNFPGYNRENISMDIVNKFLDKVEKIQYNFNIQNNKIEKNLDDIHKNNSKTVEEILNIDNFIEMVNDSKMKKIFENKLLISLVKNGYIKDNYEKSISFFKEGDLSLSDNKFLIYVDIKDKLDFTYNINNIKKVIDEIEPKDFASESVLNFNIMDYLLNNNQNQKAKVTFKQFNKLNNYKLCFLEEYMNYNKDNFIKLLSVIYNDELLNFIFNDFEIITNKEKWYKIIIENIKLKFDNNITLSMKKYTEDNIDFLNNIKLNDITIENISNMKLNIKSYDDINFPIINILYNSDTFNANRSFYNKLIIGNEMNQLNSETNCIDYIYSEEYFLNFRKKLINQDTFSEFYNSFEIFDSHEENIIAAINDIELSRNNKLLILEKECNSIKNIESILDKTIWEEIIKNSYCDISMENMLLYYKYVEKIDDVIINMLIDMDDYHYIENDNFQNFENDLIYSKSNIRIHYDKIAQEFSYNVDSLNDDLEINDYLLDELINYNKISLNIEIYNELLAKHESLLTKLIINKIDDYIKFMDEIVPDIFIIEELLKSDISSNKKILILNTIDISEISNEILSKIVDEIISKNIDLDDNLVENIFDKLEINKKIKYFIYLHKKSSTNIKYLYNIDEKISKIRNGNSTNLSFPYNENIYNLMKYLYEARIINKFEKSKGKIHISYKKEEIIN